MGRMLPKAHFDDLFQEGRIAVWLRRDALTELDADHARRSAAQTARWAMVDFARRMWPGRGKHKQIIGGSTDDWDDGEYDRPGPDDTFGYARAAEMAEYLPERIRASAPRSRRFEVFELVVQGFTGLEISERLGLSDSGVSLHRTAIAAIAKEFAD